MDAMDGQRELTGATDTLTPAAARLRTSKACEECRKRKIKCHGQSPVPCEYCRLKRLQCVYRSQARTRRRQHPTLMVPPPRVPQRAHLHNNDDVVDSPIEDTMYAGVSATYADSPSRTLQLYYGPSSNFPLIQQIHQRLNSGRGSSEAEGAEIEEMDEGLERFQYRGIFFGKHSDAQDLAYPSGGGGGGGEALGMQGRKKEDADLLFLPWHLAADFLRKFETTLQKQLPFIDPAAAEEMLGVLYGNVDGRELDVGERAILLAVLAIGATLTEYVSWAEALYRRAKTLSDELEEVVNVHVCQLTLLLAHFNSIRGKPNTVYLLMGTAVRKAFAAGLHKEALSRSRQSVDFALVQERRLTWWSIYIFEVTISYGLGRPISITDTDISIPYPEDNPFFLRMVALSRIYSRASRALYGIKPTSLFSLWRSATELRLELETFRASLPADLAVGPTAPFIPGTAEVHRLFLNNWYYHCLILTFRPFLIFHAQWQKDHRLSVSDAPERVSISSRQLRERAPWILEACDTCVQAARDLLVCIKNSVNGSELCRRLAYTCFYIEGAAFLLIFNMLRDRKSFAGDAAAVREILKTMEIMGGDTARIISQSAIRRMLTSVEGASEEEEIGETPVSDVQSEEAREGVQEGVQEIAGVDPLLDFSVGDMKLNFDLGSMDLDCWLAMDGYGGVGDLG